MWLFILVVWLFILVVFKGFFARFIGICCGALMKGIFLASLGFPLQLCCKKCSRTLTRIVVLAYA